MSPPRHSLTVGSGRMNIPDPWRTLGEAAEATVSELRRQRAAEQLHALGPRPVLEAMREISGGAELDTVLHRYAAIDPVLVRKLGGDRFPPSPLHEAVDHSRGQR
jgi:hypothetical protein